MRISGSPLQTSIAYAVVGLVWIVGSDALLTAAFGSFALGRMSPLKGLFFVLVTAPFLYLTLTRREQQLRTEAERRRSAERLSRRIFDRTYAAMLVLDGRTGRVLDANPAAERLYGVNRETLLMQRLHDLSECTDAEADAALAAATADACNYFMAHHRTASGIRDVEVYTSNVEQADEPELVLVVHDVTERLAAEQALRHSEARYRDLLERASDPIVILDARLFVREANERARQLLGYGIEQLAGLHAKDLLTPGQLERQPVRLDELAAGRIVHSERVLLRSDGVEVHTEITSRQTPEGEYELILRDVTERRQSEDQQRQQQKLEALGQLAGGIAHDLNNVLTVILANAALVRTSLADGQGDPLADLVQLEGSAHRGVNMVRKLLSFGRAAPLAIRPLDVAAVLRELEPTLRRLLPAHIRIECAAERPAPGLADAGALEQIILNLATNARDAMPEGGTLRIDVVPADSPKGMLTLDVRDSGAGMTPDTRRRVFEPFFTTKAVGAGTGLGLTVVYGLVMQQHGSISVESTPAAGTRIRISLPSTSPTEIDTTANQSDAPERWPRGSEVILLVEDEAPLRTSAARILTRLGYTVLTAEDGEAGAELFARERGRIHLVLSDVMMPRMGGKALFDAVRAQAPGFPFLFMSGYGAADLAAMQEDHGGSMPILPKPWTAGELARAVRASLDVT